MTRLSVLLPDDDAVDTLKQAGICSVEDLFCMDFSELKRKTMLPEQKLKEVMKSARMQGSANIMPATILRKVRECSGPVQYLPTGCHAMDALLQGGIRCGEVTEIVGDVASGKTQLCFSACLSSCMQLPYSALYLDSANCFSAERIHSMVPEINGTPSQDNSGAMRLISRRGVHSIWDLLDVLYATRADLAQKKSDFMSKLKLLVVDSLASLLAPVVGTPKAFGYATMMEVASLLRSLACDFHIAILITNYTVTGADRGLRPALGETWAAVPSTQILVTRGSSHHSALVRKSCRLPCNTYVDFTIEEQGLVTLQSRG